MAKRTGKKIATLKDFDKAAKGMRARVGNMVQAEFLKAPFDAVNKPKHYNVHPSGIECIEVTRHLNFCVGNAIKYLWRAGSKDGESNVKDLKKAIWYIDQEIKRIEGKPIR